MLRLQQIELSGFKSFVDPVKLSFPGGVTCIVGPNGCGKSNISDSILWVLGEQSIKTLRGSRMEDVIFSGAERRKPLGMAEATLVMSTDDPSIPHSEEGKITIARRVYRSGQSEYRVNGKRVRLKDIKDLLMDTGLGIRAYSVIEQGKVGMILSGKPQERRRLLEEAAGVTRYKTRKRVAEMKLEEATANLLRLDDIISEVDRSLRSLKRQASAARRYQEREEEYKQLLEGVLLGRWSRLAARRQEVVTQLAAATDREAELAAGVSRAEAELAAGRETLEKLARELADRHEHHSSLAARIEGRQQFLKVSRKSGVEIAERIAAGRQLAQEKEKEAGQMASSLEGLARRRLELAAELAQAEEEAGQGAARLATAEEQLAAATARVEERRRELLSAAGELQALAQRLNKEQVELEKGGYRAHHLDEELERRACEVKGAQEHLEKARELVLSLERRQAEKEAELEATRKALETAVRSEAAATEERRRLEDELRGARQRRQLLAELAEAHAEGRAALLEALGDTGIDEPEFLAGRLAAAPGWERSLDFYLGALADAVLVPEGEDPLDLALALKGRGPGASVVAPVREGGSPKRVEDGEISLSLGEALGLSPELARALPPAWLVVSDAAASRLAREHPGVAFLSPEGLWAQGGLLHVEGGESLPGVLERERELAELGETIPRLEDALEAAVARVEEEVEARSARAREVSAIDGEITRLAQELAVATARRQDAEARLKRLEAEHQTLRGEREDISRHLAEVAERRSRVAAELAGLETRQTELQAGVDAAQGALEAAKGEKENLRAERAGREGRLELLRERLDSHDRETRRIEAAVEDNRRQVRLWQDEAGRLERRHRELAGEIEAAEGELQGYLESQSTSEEEVLEAQRRLDEHRAALKLAEGELVATRARYEEARKVVEELRIRQAGMHQEAEHLAATFEERFDRRPPQEPGPPPANLAEQEADLARRKEILDRMGPVNLLAVQEYAEQEERYAFLTEQRKDVVESIERLKATIKEINQASSERFKATFEEVNKSFGEIFTRLFRGGEAEMRLLDEEDLLESGIEIMARPPGKRLQNIMLMSGGEKALTATALLFALFRSKPSPFCILDEVDAPLDDANAMRFVELVKEMSEETQFLVITHNKLTMEIAQTLYGVTMEERGVSKVVSVELDEVQPGIGEQPRAATA